LAHGRNRAETAPQVIDLGRLAEAAFQRLYKERIEPCFVANESDRVAAVDKPKSRLLIGGGIGAALAVSAFLLAAMGHRRCYSVPGSDRLSTTGESRADGKAQYCSAIADAMGVTFTLDAFDPPAFKRLRELGLAPGYSRSNFEDPFQGAYKNSAFEPYEGHLEQRHTDSKGRTRYSTVFRGQLIRMHFPREFLGVTIVRRDAGVFGVMDQVLTAQAQWPVP
jgi:hypothetical protein